MAIDIQQVQPGDLITASFFNELIRQIETLDARVIVLETGGGEGPPTGAVVITAVSPQPARVGHDVTIVGENFGFSTGGHRVRFNGVQPPAFRTGSGDSALICEVPELPGLQATGTPVTLTVNNATSSATRVVTILPAELQQIGNIDMNYKNASPDPLTAGVENEFEFLLESDALLPATMIVTPTVRTPDGATLGWPTTVLDAAHAVIANRQITVSSQEQKTFFVRVGIPAASNGTAFTLQVDGVGGGVTSSSGTQEMTVGQSADPDPEIKLSPSTSEGLSGARISAPVGTVRTIAVEADLAAVGSYAISLKPLGGLTNWTNALVTPPATSPQLPVDPDDLVGDGIADRTVQFRVRPDAGATDGQLRLTVQRTGSTRSRSFTFDLHVSP